MILKRVFNKEKDLTLNILGAFMVKGASMVLSLITLPAYIRYFKDDTILGVWYTMLSILTWITMFDLGIGNGLRNKLTETLTRGDRKQSREYISSAYIVITIVAVFSCLAYTVINRWINWMAILNVSTNDISSQALSFSMSIIVYGIFIRFILSLVTSMIYAIQKSAINNLLVFVSNFLIFIYVSVSPVGNMESNLIKLSVWQVVFSNVPLLIATIVIFGKELKGLSPKLSFFKIDKAKSVLNDGVVLLWLQVVAMVVLSTHAFLISRFVGPHQVVEYNIYFKVFNSIASLLVLALTPVWSAVTKAKTEHQYLWIKKAYKISLLLPVIAIVVSLSSFPLLQRFFDLWLGNNTIVVNYNSSIIMTIFGGLFVLHNVNTSINNGLSFFRLQSCLMSLAAILMIPLSYIFCRITNNWVGVIMGCIISMLPYQLAQPFVTFRFLNER